ncbi:MAG TPA: ABC transporter permease [Tepidisphaeraceae bacterium]
MPEYSQVLANLVLRDLKVKYQSRGLGFAWSLLHPAALLLIWYTVFHRTGLMRATMHNYWAYLLSGMLVFQFISSAIIDGSWSIRRNAGIVRKVYLPLEILVIAAVTVKFVEFLFQLVVALVLLAFLHTADTGASFSVLKTIIVLPAALILSYLLALGLALPLAAWCVIYRDLDHLVGLALTALIYLTPVFWATGMINLNDYALLVALNPIADLLALFQGPMYWGTWPTNPAVGGNATNTWFIAIGFVALIFTAGWLLFTHSKRFLAEVV